MAAQFDTTRTVLQPGQQEAPAQTDVFQYGAQVAGTLGGFAMQDAALQTNRMSQLYAGAINTASSGFDRVLSEYNKYAEQKAMEDAPAAVKFDGDNNIIPPASFYPPGINTRAYGQTYANAYRAAYKSSAEQELINYAAVQREKFAADPPGFRKAMAEKTAAMQQNLDPSVAPWIDLRGKQIESQGLTQLTVQAQSARNRTMQLGADRATAALTEDIRRDAVSSPYAQGGGGSQPAYDNNSANITTSADNYSGGKGLPYKVEGNNHVFETFESAEHGVAAHYGLIKKKVQRAGGTMSISDLVQSWDPNGSPEVKANYAAALAKSIGATPGGYVPIDDPDKMAALIKAQNRFEKGKHTVSDSAIENGIKLANGEKNVPLTNVVSSAVPADPKAVEQATTAAVNNATIQQRIADIKAQAQAGGEQPALTEYKINEAITSAQIGAIGEQIRNSARSLFGTDGLLNPGAVAAAEDRIDTIARSGRFPGREDQVRGQLLKDLDFAKNQASLRAQQVQVDDKRAMAPVQRQMMADSAAAKDAANREDSVTALTITRQLEAQGRAILNDKSVSDSVAMTMASTAFQNGSISRGALQESYTSRLQSLGAIVSDPAASPEQKAAAYENAKAIRNDVEVHREMTPTQRGALQGIMDGYVQQNYAGQMASFHREGLAGLLTPQKIDAVRFEQIQKGMIPVERAAEFAAIDEQMKAAYHKKGTQSRQAGEFLDNFSKARPSTPDQLEAHKKETGWKPPGGGPTVDWAKPDHVTAVQEHYRKFGYMPDAAKVSFDATQHSPNDADIVGQKAMLETVRQVERAQIEKMTGKIYDPDQEKMLEQNVAGIVGKNYTYLSNAIFHNSALAASKISLDERSKAGALGQTADQSKGSMDQAAQRLAGQIAKTQLNVVSQILEGPLSYLRGDDANLTPEQKAIREATGITPGGNPLDYLIGMTGLTNRGNFEKVVIDPGLSDALGRRATVHLATDGNAIRTGPNRDDPEGFVYGTAFYSAIRNGEISASVSADGKTVTYGWKTLGDHVAPALGTKMTKGMEQVFAANILSAERTRIDGNLAVIDPTRTYVRSYQAPNGQLRYFIAEQDRNGNFTRGMDLAKDDPRIGVQALATTRAATQAVVGVSEGTIKPNIYGSAALFALTGPFGAAVTAIDQTTGIPLKWPVEGHLKAGAMIGNAIQQMQVAVNRPGMTEAILGTGKPLTAEQAEARKNMQTHTVKLLQELDAEMQKIPNAANLKEVLSHMLDNHAPGVDNSALREMIKNSGFYQPGRLPQVQTGPSRIGKDAK